MRIAIISYWSCPLTRLGVLAAGGMNVYVLNLVNNLAKLGHEVDVYTRVHKESDEEVVKMHKQVRIIHLTTDSPDLYQDILLYAKKLMDFIEKNSLKYDIIHTHYFYSGLV